MGLTDSLFSLIRYSRVAKAVFVGNDPTAPIPVNAVSSYGSYFTRQGYKVVNTAGAFADRAVYWDLPIGGYVIDIQRISARVANFSGLVSNCRVTPVIYWGELGEHLGWQAIGQSRLWSDITAAEQQENIAGGTSPVVFSNNRRQWKEVLNTSGEVPLLTERFSYNRFSGSNFHIGFVVDDFDAAGSVRFDVAITASLTPLQTVL